MAQIYKTMEGLSFILAGKKMRILVVAATKAEIEPVMLDFETVSSHSQKPHVIMPDVEISKYNPGIVNLESEIQKSQISSLQSPVSFLITGVGMVATAFSLGQHLANNQYELVINLGIAGSFDRNIALGSVLEVFEDTFAELGAEDDLDFLPLSKLGFGEETFKASAALLNYNLPVIQQVSAITVNTVHGNAASILRVVNRLNAKLESMEGAAVFYACLQAGIPCMQIRAVSNFVEKRNRASWQIGLAVKNLNIFAKDLLMKMKDRG